MHFPHTVILCLLLVGSALKLCAEPKIPGSLSISVDVTGSLSLNIDVTCNIFMNQLATSRSLFNRCYFRRLYHIPVHFSRNTGFVRFCLLLLAGDVSTNPGPDSLGNIKLGFTNIRSLPKNIMFLFHTSLE